MRTEAIQDIALCGPLSEDLTSQQRNIYHEGLWSWFIGSLCLFQTKTGLELANRSNMFVKVLSNPGHGSFKGQWVRKERNIWDRDFASIEFELSIC